MSTTTAPETATNELPTKWLIVGAGPGGLIAARAARRRGIDVEIVERHSEIGGIWNIDNPGSPMYETCNFISSKKRGGFIGYPMPEEYPDYPTWWQVRDYVRKMAADYGLDQIVELNTEVREAVPVQTPAGTYWQVTLGNGEVRKYRGVVYAGGHEWHGFKPQIPGMDTFTGIAIHSQEYRSPELFTGKRVLVMGAGNSGVDIASDAALHADRAFLSTRRGYWFLPKQVFGKPVADLLAGHEEFPDLPVFKGLTPEQKVEVVLSANGDITRFGLPAPDHPVTATHPIVSNTIVHFLSHGLLTPKRDVERIDGSVVHFVDGSSEEIDVIVMATGYDINIPIVPEGYIEYFEGKPVSHLYTFFPNLDNFYAVGLTHAADNGWQNFDEFSQLFVADMVAVMTGENAENVRRMKEEYDPDLTGGFEFVKTRRNVNQLFVPAMREMLAYVDSEFGVTMPEFFDEEFYADQLVARESVGV